jgi:hypothetical protein
MSTNGSIRDGWKVAIKGRHVEATESERKLSQGSNLNKDRRESLGTIVHLMCFSKSKYAHSSRKSGTFDIEANPVRVCSSSLHGMLWS